MSDSNRLATPKGANNGDPDKRVNSTSRRASAKLFVLFRPLFKHSARKIRKYNVTRLSSHPGILCERKTMIQRVRDTMKLRRNRTDDSRPRFRASELSEPVAAGSGRSPIGAPVLF
jgi:hypothetical protein